MNNGVRTEQQHIEDAMDAADVAWWELEFPSGALKFSKKKTEMLGYEHDKFVHFTHFTVLIHEDDYESSMKAMSDHYSGKAEYYETTYRILHKNGEYITFHDKGKIVERTDDGFVVAGIVRKVNDVV